jgi:glycosyltransferase involved in cell wall biosynthesis
MDLVTITDHNTIEGSLQIAHLDDTFISEEITTYFPEDRCKLHVLAFDINEAQHRDISKIRENVYELVDYLRTQGIVYALAHPLYSINDRLRPEHIEQSLVLFQNFELNGSRDHYQNNALKYILKDLTEEDLLFLADKHSIELPGPDFWKKNLISGSDDHSSLNIACNYTEVSDAVTVAQFLEGIVRHRARVQGLASSPKKMAHNLYSIAYQFYNEKFNLNRYLSKDLLLRFVDRALIPSLEGERFSDRLKHAFFCRKPYAFFKSAPDNLQDLFQKKARKIVYSDRLVSDLLHKSKHRPDCMEKAWFRFVNQMSEKILHQFGDSILENVSGARLFDIFHTIGSAGSLYTMLAPYFVAYTVFTKDRRFCGNCRQHFSRDSKLPAAETPNVAHFTDTFYDINGVALTLQKQVEISQKNSLRQTIITCSPNEDSPGVKNFAPFGTFNLPEYPELKLHYPPLLQMLDYCYENNFNQIHSATPGPIGLAALAIAKILKIPISGTYHTSLPQYASQLTDDAIMEEAMWKYCIWYYNQMEKIYVPSKATGDELIAKGMSAAKISYYRRGIDVERFHPGKRNGFFKTKFNLAENKMKLLYVGRVSREKNLQDLVEAIKTINTVRSDFHLIVVGGGPYLEEMKKYMAGLPVTFCGYLVGEDLDQAYASSDIFIFPSATDTFGNVVLEAQASGLPVIVSDTGGPQENMVHSQTGFIFPTGNIEALTQTLLNLMDDPQLLQKMKQNARNYMDNRSFESAYLRFWNSYTSTAESYNESTAKC